jgi:hypothetical protein
MNSEISPSSSFAALPVRRRETLEIFDTALKLYRRYFWVLIGWSALVSATALTSIFAGPLYLLTMPFLYGSVSCCVAGAVRGQNVGFRQCWQFSKPRYGAMLGVLFLSFLVFLAAMMALYLAMFLIGIAGISLLANAPEPVQIVAAVIGVITWLLFVSVAGVVAFGWVNMVPIVACLEDDKRGTAAMGRAFELLKGHWRRVFGMSLVLGLAVLAVLAIVGGLYGLFNMGAIQEVFGGDFSESGFMGLMMTFGGFMSVFSMLWIPAQNLVIAVLYLDLRVRREALDLEWTAYSSAPAPAPITGEFAPNHSSLAAENTSVSPDLTAPATFAPSPASFSAASPTSFSSSPVEVPAALEVTPNNDAPQISLGAVDNDPVISPREGVEQRNVVTEEAERG